VTFDLTVPINAGRGVCMSATGEELTAPEAGAPSPPSPRRSLMHGGEE
jgi:hypothetical protein